MTYRVDLEAVGADASCVKCFQLKEHYVDLGKTFYSKGKQLFFYALSNQINKLSSKQTDLTGKHIVMLFLLCLYVVDPPTFLAKDSVPRTLFPFENSLLFQSWAQ